MNSFKKNLKDNKFHDHNFGEAGRLYQINLNFGKFLNKGLVSQVDYIKESNILKMKNKHGI